MSLIAKDLPTLVFMLLPGFLAAGIFHTLTAHPKSSEFERVIQALIFTTILKFATIVLRGLFLGLGAVRPHRHVDDRCGTGVVDRPRRPARFGVRVAGEYR